MWFICRGHQKSIDTLYLFAKDDLSGWVESRAINAVNSYNVAKFLYKDVLCRHGCPKQRIKETDTALAHMSVENHLPNYIIRHTIKHRNSY